MTKHCIFKSHSRYSICLMQIQTKSDDFRRTQPVTPFWLSIRTSNEFSIDFGTIIFQTKYLLNRKNGRLVLQMSEKYCFFIQTSKIYSNFEEGGSLKNCFLFFFHESGNTSCKSKICISIMKCFQIVNYVDYC